MKRLLIFYCSMCCWMLPSLVVAQVHDSVMWDYTRKMFLGDALYQFDDRIRVSLPEFAEDSMQVPVSVDASSIDEPIVKMITWADYNPIQHIFTYHPESGMLPQVSITFKVQQSTPVRAAVLTESGQWLVGSGYVSAAGGGCTLPSESRMNDDWQSSLGQIRAGRFSRSDQPGADRYKFRIMHPMDSGLVANIPSFYLEQVELRNANGDLQVRLDLSPAVSENPSISFDLLSSDQNYQLWVRDNDGNEFQRAL